MEIAISMFLVETYVKAKMLGNSSQRYRGKPMAPNLEQQQHS